MVFISNMKFVLELFYFKYVKTNLSRRPVSKWDLNLPISGWELEITKVRLGPMYVYLAKGPTQCVPYGDQCQVDINIYIKMQNLAIFMK